MSDAAKVGLYQKKPVQVEAVQWQPVTKEYVADVLRWIGDGALLGLLPGDGSGAVLTIKTLEGTMETRPGDWIIRGVKGEFYPCKPDIFDATYEPVMDDG
jgi:hypothetical protein